MNSQSSCPVNRPNVIQLSVVALGALTLVQSQSLLGNESAVGTVVAWGASAQTNIPTGLSNVIAIAGGEAHSMALKADGTVVAWGSNNLGQTNVPDGLSNVVAIDAGNL